LLVAASARLGEWCRFSNAFVGTGRAHNRDFIDAGSSVEIGGTFTLEAWIWGVLKNYPFCTAALTLYLCTASDPTSKDWKTIVSRAPLFWHEETEVPNVFTDFNFQVDDFGRLSFFMGNGMAAPWQYGLLLLSNRTVPAKQWVHAAVSVSALGGGATPFEAVMYLDGQVVDEDVWGDGVRQHLPDSPVRISRYDNTDKDRQYWDGKIDELRIWNTARTRDQILATMFLSLNEASAAELSLYYKFDVEPRDDQAIIPDQSGKHRDGLVQQDGPIAPVYFDRARICVQQKN
jgi:hypothetical protein